MEPHNYQDEEKTTPISSIVHDPRHGTLELSMFTMSQMRYRSSCDACLAAKLKCDQVKPCCARCLSSKRECIYSQYRKIGRPSRKTSEAVENVRTGLRPKSASTSTYTREAQRRSEVTTHRMIDSRCASVDPLGCRNELDMFAMGISEWNQSPSPLQKVPPSDMDMFVDSSIFYHPASMNELSASAFPSNIPEIGDHAAYMPSDTLFSLDDPSVQTTITPSSSLSSASTIASPTSRNSSNDAFSAPSWSAAAATSSIELFAPLQTNRSDQNTALQEMHRTTEFLPAGKAETAPTHITTSPFLFSTPATGDLSRNPQCVSNCVGELSTILNKLSEDDLADSHWTMDSALELERKIWNTNYAISKCSACMAPTRRGLTLMLLCMVLSKGLGCFEKAKLILVDDALCAVSQSRQSNAGHGQEHFTQKHLDSKALYQLRLGSIVLGSHARDFLWIKLSKIFVNRLFSLVQSLELSLAGLPKADISTKVTREVLQDITIRGECFRGILVYAEQQLATIPEHAIEIFESV